jgi:hypothetical protein
LNEQIKTLQTVPRDWCTHASDADGVEQTAAACYQRCRLKGYGIASPRTGFQWTIAAAMRLKPDAREL